MVLVGYKLLPEPDVCEAVELLKEQTILDTKWIMLCNQHQLTISEMDWVTCTGSFRVAYTTVSMHAARQKTSGCIC